MWLQWRSLLASPSMISSTTHHTSSRVAVPNGAAAMASTSSLTEEGSSIFDARSLGLLLVAPDQNWKVSVVSIPTTNSRKLCYLPCEGGHVAQRQQQQQQQQQQQTVIDTFLRVYESCERAVRAGFVPHPSCLTSSLRSCTSETNVYHATISSAQSVL